MKTLTGLQEPLRDLAGEILLERTQENLLAFQQGKITPEEFQASGQPATLGKMLANMLARASSDDPVRAIDIALRLHRADGALEVDDADIAMLVQAVTSDQQLTNLGKAAALSCLDGDDSEAS